MIRDITIGQYYPADSVIHKLDPRTKLVGTIGFIVSVFLFHTFVGYAVATIFLAGMILLSKVPVKFIFKGLKTIFMLLLITIFFNRILTPGEVVWKLGFIKITQEGLVLAGIAMSYAQISRPASGLEHYFSHVWEMRALASGGHADLHGIQVGVGTILTLKIYDRIKTITPDKQKALDYVKHFDTAAWEANVRRVFGATAPAVLEIEKKTGKNDPVKHAARLEQILAHWDEIQKIIREELPDTQTLQSVMAATGMPTTPHELGLTPKDVSDAFVCARDIRDKYLSCSMLWDLGELDDFAKRL